MRQAVVAVLWLLGCGKVPLAPDAGPVDAPMMRDANTALTEVVLVSNSPNRDLDVLFVIDDSPTMLDKQTNLKNSFASFVATLSAGGLPNLHLGVITTDVGTQGADDTSTSQLAIGSGPGSCSGLGKQGNLVTNNSTLVNGNFISDGNGLKNYSGTLTEAFNSLASVGASGCGFEQPMHALQRALSNNPNNAGFLRPDARLGIVVLSDEDDCSARTNTLFANDPTTLGPLQSFRCTRFGVTCDVGGTTPTDMNQVGVKSQCHSNESSTYVTDVARYATFLRGLKDDPREVVFGAIVGNPTPVEVELRAPPGGATAIPAVAHSCMYSGGTGMEVADPAVRLAELANALPQGSVSTVCSGNLQTQMTSIAARLKPLVGDACLQSEIAQPAVCEAFDLVGMALVPLPACDANKTPPCFELVADPTVCTVGTQHLRVSILRGTTTAPDWTSVRCQL